MYEISRLTLIAVNVGISSKIFWALALGFMTNDGTQGVI
jgi:hypothetical protein